MSREFDVVIVGGGMVGATLAGLLARGGAGVRTAVLEAREPPPFEPAAPAGNRVSAISRGSMRILAAAGVWDLIASLRISPYREMRVWDAAGEAFGTDALHFDSAELGEPDLGAIVENGLIQWALAERLRGLSEVSWMAPARLEALEFESERVVVALEDGRRLRARLVVGADGAASTSRQLAGIETAGWDYPQHAVVAHVSCEAGHRETAWQRFLPTGPLAFLPLSDGRCSIVWSTTPERAGELLALTGPEFCAAVTAASDGVLGNVTAAAGRAAFPLRLRYAKAYTRPRFALIGDAAHAVHPLAGQGVNLGFLDAAALAECLGEGIADGRDPGDRRVLRRYERWRKGDNMAAMFVIDGIGRLFSSDSDALANLRRFGLGFVNAAPTVKHEFIRRAMGVTGDLPRLARNG
jgi:2-octaprenylphenol hydroxylase